MFGVWVGEEAFVSETFRCAREGAMIDGERGVERLFLRGAEEGVDGWRMRELL